jgi:hypothetical protein
LLPGLAKKFQTIEQRTVRMGMRGSYSNRGKVTCNKEDIDVLDIEIDVTAELSEGFFAVEGDGILPLELAEHYNYFNRRQMPNEFLEPINSNTELGTKAKLQASHY